MPDTKLLLAVAGQQEREDLARAIRSAGWPCDEAKNGIVALKMLRLQDYCLVVMDADLPEVDGLIVCRHLRNSSETPAILLGTDISEESRLAAFKEGASDWMAKPLYISELLARIRNLLYLCGRASSAERVVLAGPIRVETLPRTAFVEGERVKLSPREYELLLFFCKNPYRAFSRDKLLDQVWGEAFFGTDRTVDTHIKSLRTKLGPHGRMIQTVWGYGYKFEPAEVL